MNLELIIVIGIVIIVAVVRLVGLVVTVRGAPPGRAPKPTSAPLRALQGVRVVIDHSIGMYVVRRLTGRPMSPSTDADPAERGPGAAWSASTREVPLAGGGSLPRAEGVPEGHSAIARTSRAAVSFYATEPPRPAPVSHPTSIRAAAVSATPAGPSATTVAPRARLVRDTGVALVGLTILGLALATLWPHGSIGPSGRGDPGVVRASTSITPGTGTAATTLASPPNTNPSGDVLSETGRPAGAPAVSPVVAPTATHATLGTPKPTTKPTATPAGSTPDPTPAFTPGLNPSPEPSQ
jgi:hypothetical protein